MTPELESSIDGYLGMILGCSIGALLRLGHSSEEVLQMVGMAMKSAGMTEDPKLSAAVEVLAEAATAMIEEDRR